MNDKRIEDMLRKSWSPEPPEGMRDRVLRGSRQKNGDGCRRFQFTLTWRGALVGLGLVLVFVANTSDGTTQSRLTEMTHAGPTSSCALVAQSPLTLGQWRRGVDELLSRSGSGEFGMKGVDMP